MSNDEIYDHIAEIQKGDAVDYMKGMDMSPPPVYSLSSDAVAKRVRYPERNEAYMMEYVSSRTSICIPRVRRVLPAQDGDGYWIIMDRIQGESLLRCWPRLGIWRKLHTLWTLWSYLRQLRRLPLPNSSTPGPFDGTNRPLRCRGLQFPEEGGGPFATYTKLADWFDYQLHCHQVARHLRTGGALVWRMPKFPRRTESLVLAHGDLHMRNIMLDDGGRVWLVDWDCAGAYPPWWDYGILRTWANAASVASRVPPLFARLLPWIAGDYRRLYDTYWGPLTKVIESVSGDAQTEDPDYFEKLGIPAVELVISDVD